MYRAEWGISLAATKFWMLLLLLYSYYFYVSFIVEIQEGSSEKQNNLQRDQNWLNKESPLKFLADGPHPWLFLLCLIVSYRTHCKFSSAFATVPLTAYYNICSCNLWSFFKLLNMDISSDSSVAISHDIHVLDKHKVESWDFGVGFFKVLEFLSEIQAYCGNQEIILWFPSQLVADQEPNLLCRCWLPSQSQNWKRRN